MLDRIVGSANESEILINGVKTSGLIDTGSMVTSVSEDFYTSLKPLPKLHLITDLAWKYRVQMVINYRIRVILKLKYQFHFL